MGYVTFPRAVAFDGADGPMTKGQALKVLEEAAELVEAVKGYAARRTSAYARMMAVDEAVDVYQELANLLAGEFSDEEVAGAYGRCAERNRGRGRL